MHLTRPTNLARGLSFQLLVTRFVMKDRRARRKFPPIAEVRQRDAQRFRGR